MDQLLRTLAPLGCLMGGMGRKTGAGMTATLTGPAGRMQIARGLIALRERCGLTQSQVAERAGVSKATVSRYEMWQDRPVFGGRQ